jgi:hypothetical protein
MVALSARSLIAYWDVTQDTRIIPALKNAADILWAEYWLPQNKAFKYTNIDTRNLPPSVYGYNTGGTEPAPDLNLIIVPLFGFLYHVTGDITYIQRGDEIFTGGVVGAYLSSAKQFNQNYFWSFDYLKYRSLRPRQ